MEWGSDRTEQFRRPGSTGRIIGQAVPRLVGLVLPMLLSACSELGETARYRQDLAIHLSVNGAKMYGAYWCPHCATQKELFGTAADQIPYIECDPDGDNSQTDLCQQKGIQAYPTWEINGEFRQGVHPLGKLADLTEFPPPPAQWFEPASGGGHSPVPAQ